MSSPYLSVTPEFADLFKDTVGLEGIWDLGDAVVRDHGERRTTRLERNGTILYVKRYGAPRHRWFRKRDEPSAESEYQALKYAEDAGVQVPRIAAIGVDEEGRSAIVLVSLPDTVSLEAVAAGWREAPPSPAVKRAVIGAVAETARRLHAAGINHRDLYLAHFHVPREDPTQDIWLIDLQRAQRRESVPHRWLVKDLGGLWFSAMEAGLTRSDLFRFLKTYTGDSPARVLKRDKAFWRSVERRARRTHKKHGGVPLPPHLRSSS